MNMFKTTLIAAALASAGFAGNAAAATDDENFQVTITITESCQINSASNIAFADKARSSTADISASGSLSVTCTPNTSYKIGLSNGSNYSSSRRMANGANFVSYGLFRDAAFAQAWGTLASADTLAGTGTGNPVTIPVYALVAGGANVNVPAGNYSDTVVATIEY
jgi:spore coat protein U-like protein